MTAGLMLKAPEDAEFLRRFRSAVAELQRRSVLRRRNLLNASITFAGGRTKFKHNLRDPERVAAFLADVRKFHLKCEPFFLPKIFNWLHLRIRGPELRRDLADLRAAYQAALKQGMLRIVHKGEEFSPEKLLDLYLNGLYFHNDSEKRELIDELEQPDLFPRVVAMEAAVAIARTAKALTWIITAAENGRKVAPNPRSIERT